MRKSGGPQSRNPALMALARSGSIDCIVVTKLDRVARSLKNLVAMLDELTSLNVQFVSLRDQIDLTSASGRLMVHIIGAFAEFERGLVRERTVAGLAYARSQGVKLGRPSNVSVERVAELRSQGKTYRQICEELRCGPATVRAALVKATTKTA
jgi:DNA invertase Pin-like site-specific DNA recombinase